MKLLKCLVVACFVVGIVGISISADKDTKAAGKEGAKNLVKNGDFEDTSGGESSPFAYWGFWGQWENGMYTIAVSKGHSGKYCAKISCDTKGRGGLYYVDEKNEMGINPGDKIKLTVWAKAKDANDGRLFVNMEGTPGDGWATMDLKQGTYDWTKFEKEMQVPYAKPKKEGGVFHINIYIYNKSSGELYIDDVSLVKTKEAKEIEE